MYFLYRVIGKSCYSSFRKLILKVNLWGGITQNAAKKSKLKD